MFFQGLILGFSVAAPIGPINLLCIQRTLDRGRLHGFISGLGAATADTFYGLIVALGLSAIMSFLLGQQLWLQLGGGAFLLAVGLKTAVTKPGQTASGPADDAGLARAYLSVLLLTLANPATMLLFFGVFAALGIGSLTGRPAAGLLLVAGVFLGSAVWWLLLSFLAGLFRAHLTDGRMRWVNRVAGLAIFLLGLWSLWPIVRAKLL